MFCCEPCPAVIEEEREETHTQRQTKYSRRDHRQKKRKNAITLRRFSLIVGETNVLDTSTMLTVPEDCRVWECLKKDKKKKKEKRK